MYGRAVNPAAPVSSVRFLLSNRTSAERKTGMWALENGTAPAGAAEDLLKKSVLSRIFSCS
jgi:hypothetical protein